MVEKIELINFAILEAVILDIEDKLKDFNMVERDLILKQVINRANDRLRQTQAKDVMGNISFRDLFKRAKKGINEENNNV